LHAGRGIVYKATPHPQNHHHHHPQLPVLLFRFLGLTQFVVPRRSNKKGNKKQNSKKGGREEKTEIEVKVGEKTKGSELRSWSQDYANA